jgi:hypothetical protein
MLIHHQKDFIAGKVLLIISRLLNIDNRREKSKRDGNYIEAKEVL